MCPASTQYALGTPLFKKAVVTRPDGKKFTIDAPDNGPEAFYVQSLKVNGKPWAHNYVEYDDLVRGAKLKFGMGSMPDTGRGTKVEDKPYSFSQEQ